VEVAILVDCDRLRVTSAEYRLRFIGQIDAVTTILGLYVDKADVVLRQHWMSHATHLNLNMTVVNLCNNGNVLLVACINRIRNQLLHRYATTYNRDL
jgi:hypothetical protein